jgi:hypothetical protein
MVVRRRVPSPRSVRHLLQVHQCQRLSECRGQESPARQAWTERVLACVAAARALCAGEVQLCCERTATRTSAAPLPIDRAAAARSIAAENGEVRIV